MMLFTFLSWCIASAMAHMAISAYPADVEIPARDKKSLNDAYRNPASRACHGTARGDVQFEIAPGTKLQAKTTYGAGHDGGHCAWFISADETTWYKLNDKLDCTRQGASSPHHVTIPANVPLDCKDKCTLGWFWTPRSSGQCEVYSDCFDIKVTGAAGGIETAASTVKIVTTNPLTCQRIDNTGATVIYGALRISDDGEVPDGTDTGPGTIMTMPPDVTVDGTTGCTKYTVKSGDTLSAIAERFDIEKWEDISELNKLLDPDSLAIDQVLLMPGDCTAETTGAPDDKTTDTGSSGAAMKSLQCAFAFLFCLVWF